MARQEPFSRRTRRPKHLRTVHRSVLIVTQGEVTERVYLDALKRLWRLSAIKVLPHAKDPVAIVEWTGRVARQGGQYDETWAVIDTEATTSTETFDRVKALANKLGVRVVWSNPCIEIWLLLHFRYSNSHHHDARNAIQALERLIPDYGKDWQAAKRSMAHLIDQIDQALVNAEQLRNYHRSQNQEGCRVSPSTDMDHLVRSIKPTGQDGAR